MNTDNAVAVIEFPEHIATLRADGVWTGASYPTEKTPSKPIVASSTLSMIRDRASLYLGRLDPNSPPKDPLRDAAAYVAAACAGVITFLREE